VEAKGLKDAGEVDVCRGDTGGIIKNPLLYKKGQILKEFLKKEKYNF
jgi:hypothetical protein